MSAIDYLDVSPGWNRILANSTKLRQRIGRFPRSAGLEVLPGILSDDPRYLAFMEAVRDHFSTDEWLPQVNEATGLSKNFLSDDIPRAVSVAGYLKLPRPIPQPSNAQLRADLDLPTEFLSLRDTAIFDELFELLYTHARPASMYFRPKASTTIPDFSTDVTVKKNHLRHSLKVVLAHDAIDLKLCNRTGLFPVYYAVNRLQADKPGKVRTVWTGYEYEQASEETPFPGHIGMRVRLAYAMSGTVSYVMSLPMVVLREYYLNEYDFTYKHRDMLSRSAKINKYRAVRGVDVTNFDTTVADFLLDRYIENFRKFDVFKGSLVDLLRLTLGGVSIAGSPHAEENAKRFSAVGDPYDESTFALTRGLPSGHPLNPDIGKFLMTFDLLTRAARCGVKVLGRIDTLLRGQDPQFALLNSADDNLLLGDDADLLNRIIETPGYFKLDREEVPTFLGAIAGGEPGRVVCHMNLFSFILRFFVPEHPIGHKLGDNRAFINIAWTARVQAYGEHPLFTTMYAELDKLAQLHLGAPLRSLIMRQDDPQLPHNVVGNYVDQRYLENPDRIHYEFSVDEVSPELLGSGENFLTADRTMQLAKLVLGRGVHLGDK